MTLPPPEPLALDGDVVDLLQALVDIESVSRHEKPIADEVERALRAHDHLEVTRLGDAVVARTNLGRAQRVLIAGHLDTVPLTDPPNLPCRVEGDDADKILIGRGTCDMKGGVAVALSLAAELTEPVHDVTWVFYDQEEIEAIHNGLGRIAAERPDLLAGDFAVLGEPTSARVEGGCKGTMRFEITTTGVAAHSGRPWRGHNAIHDAGDLLNRLNAYQPQAIDVDGLVYREGLNAVGIRGGAGNNVIPDRCTVTINYRFAPDKGADEATAHMREVFDGHELTITDMSPGARPGLHLPAAQAFLAAVGGVPQPKDGWTDVARFAELGVPAVNYGPGDPGKAHADDEFCPASDVYACRDALHRWLTGKDAS